MNRILRHAHPWQRSRYVGFKTLVLLMVFGVLLVLPSLLPLDPYRVDLDAILRPPSVTHPLGTDENGRDVLARLLLGARATLGIGLGATLVAIVLGTAIGALAGYHGGLLDSVLMRCVDFALAFPSLFAILLFTAVFSSGPAQLIFLIGLTGWMTTARLVRARMQELLAAPYVEAARSLGAGVREVICNHLVPNLHGILFVAGLVQLSRSILAEATISFLGFGVQPPTPTWGSLLIGAQNYVYTGPWLALAPGLAITGTLLAISRLGIGGLTSRGIRTPRVVPGLKGIPRSGDRLFGEGRQGSWNLDGGPDSPRGVRGRVARCARKSKGTTESEGSTDEPSQGGLFRYDGERPLGDGSV